MGVKETYVSPMLRLAFLREDHPGLDIAYGVMAADESGIHPAFRADCDWFVTCTITIPGCPPVVAWKEVPKQEERWVNKQKRMVPFEMTPESLIVLQTKALGRACKQLGYPDDMTEFKSLVLWRQRNREIASLGQLAVSPTAGALPSGRDDEMSKALDAAGRTDDEERATKLDDDDQPIADATVVDAAGNVVNSDGEIIEPPADADEDALATYMEVIAAVEPDVKLHLAAWAKDRGIRNIMAPLPNQAQDLLNWLDDYENGPAK